MKRSLPLNGLRVFELAAQHLSFTKASEELCLTAAAVSHHIKQLEQHLGVALFVRNNNKLQLTVAGEHYFPRVREAFRALQQATDQLLNDRNTVLRVSVPAVFGTKWLVPRLFRFFDRHPEIGVEVVTDPQSDPSGSDIAIDDRSIEPPGMATELLVATGYAPVCSPALAASLRTPRDLAGCVLLHERQSRRAQQVPGWEQWLQQVGMEMADVMRGPTFSDPTMMLQAAIEGQGVALSQHVLVAYDLAAGRLVEPFGIDAGLQHSYYLCCPLAADLRPEIAIFRDWLFAEARATASGEAS
ncbi:LysR substrate-binding domain-containing protein [Dyella silvatica]|uniref:LysR substrate-binding domain-containing protein n=1 Tax=Dyella silvatica TaxID=2992128 RepID=UPI002252B5FF|nr:LysR substrate-binding domain-containing protein [Dyella silvatica]